VASPRDCCTELDNRDTAQAVEGRTRLERQETALGQGACRESILIYYLCSIERNVVEEAGWSEFVKLLLSKVIIDWIVLIG